MSSRHYSVMSTGGGGYGGSSGRNQSSKGYPSSYAASTHHLQDIQKEIGERKKTSAEARELEKNLTSVLKSIPMEFRDKNFSHIVVVARALKKLNPESDLNELNEYYKTLNKAVSDIVDVNYKGFNKSIRNFSDILNNLNAANNEITNLEKDIESCKDLLESRSDDLAQLYSTYLQHTEFLKILNEVEEIRGVPEILNKAIESKHYLYAVKMIERYEEMLQKRELKNVKALNEIKEYLVSKKKMLPELLMDALSYHCYHNMDDQIGKGHMVVSERDILLKKSQKILKNENHNSNLDDVSSSSHSQIGTPISPPGLSPTSENPSISQSDAFSKQKLSNNTSQDKLNIDPEKDSASFMKMLIDSLDSLKQLPQAQSRLIHGLRFDLQSVMNKHFSQFSKQMEQKGSAAMLKAFIASLSTKSSHDPMEAYQIALKQGDIFNQMIISLYKKLLSVLKNYRFIIDVMSTKFDKKAGYKGHESSTGSFDLSLNISVSAEVLARLRDAVRIKLDDLRSAKRSDTVYINALEDLLFNFIDKDVNYQLQSMKVNAIPDMFWGMVRTQIQVKHGDTTLEGRYMYIKQDFSSLLSNAFSSSDTPRFLTIEHIWKTIQHELKSVMKDMLSISSEEIEENPKVVSSHDNTAPLSNRKRTGLRFRFGTNIESDAKSSASPTTQQHLVPNSAVSKASLQSSGLIAIFSNLAQYFRFSPYNMIWIYSSTKEFMDNGKMIVESVLVSEEKKNGTSATNAIDRITNNSSTSITYGTNAVNDQYHYPYATSGSGNVGKFANMPSIAAGNYTTNTNLNILMDFMNDSVKQSLIPRIKDDYRKRLNELLSQPDAFQPREYLNIKTNSNFSTIETQRPLLNSVIHLRKWIIELFQFSNSINTYKQDFYEIIEQILEQYLRECRNQLQNIVSTGYGNFVRECLSNSEVLSILKMDVQYKLLIEKMKKMTKLLIDAKSVLGDPDGDSKKTLPSSDAFFNDSDGEQKGKALTYNAEKFDENMRLIVDKTLIQAESINKYMIICDSSSTILLCNLNDSLEWIAEQMVLISKLKQLLIIHNQKNDHNFGDFVNENDNHISNVKDILMDFNDLSQKKRKTSSRLVSELFSPRSSDIFSAMMMGSSDILPEKTTAEEIMMNSEKNTFPTKTLESLYYQYLTFSHKCLFSLKIDLRSHCYYFLGQLKNTNYMCEEESIEPDSSIKALNNDMIRIEKCLSMYLPPYKIRYTFEGLPALISEVLINSLKFMKKAKFNHLGIEKMKRNVFAIEQNLINILPSDTIQYYFCRVIEYYKLLEMSEHEYLSYLGELEEPDYSIEQYKAIMKTETHVRGSLEESDTNKKWIIFCELLQKLQRLQLVDNETNNKGLMNDE